MCMILECGLQLFLEVSRATKNTLQFLKINIFYGHIKLIVFNYEIASTNFEAPVPQVFYDSLS